MVPSHSSPPTVKPAVIASAAPKLAPEVMPRVEGLASALAVIVLNLQSGQRERSADEERRHGHRQAK